MQGSPQDPLLVISKLCLVTMQQVETMSSVIFGLSPAPSSQTSQSGVGECLYSGSFAAGSTPTKFLSITVLPTWSGMSHHIPAQPGFANASAGVVHLNGYSLVEVGAQITSGSQNGQWLVLVVGNNGPPLVSLTAIETTLSEAETQYSNPNVGRHSNPSSSPSASTGGHSSGNVACKLVSPAVADQFAPPDANPPLKAIVTGSGKHQFDPGTTDYVCGFAFWTGGAVNSGMEDGWVVLDLACGPNAASTVLGDEVSSSTFIVGGTTAAVGLTRYRGSAGTGDPQAVLNGAESVAKDIHACG